MKLGTYLKQNGISHDEFAKVICVSEAAVSRYVNGRRRPKDEIMENIVKATRGLVTPNDFFGVNSASSAELQP